MKKFLLLLLCAALMAMLADFLYARSRADDLALEHSAWLCLQDPYSIRVQFLGDSDGILPLDRPYVLMTVYDWGAGAEPLLDGYELWEGSWIYDGAWSLKDQVLTLRTETGMTIRGEYDGETILLRVGDGYRLEKFMLEE